MYLATYIEGEDFMKEFKDMDAKLQSEKQKSNHSRNSKTGYMDIGNAGKIAAKQGTRNK